MLIPGNLYKAIPRKNIDDSIWFYNYKIFFEIADEMYTSYKNPKIVFYISTEHKNLNPSDVMYKVYVENKLYYISEYYTILKPI